MLVGLRRSVLNKGIHFVRRRQQAGQIERYPADQSCFAGLGRRMQPFPFQPGQNESVYRRFYPSFFFYLRQRGAHRFFKRPVGPVVCALREPTP